jgi:ABC-type lipoprotein export system ATPase subunit
MFEQLNSEDGITIVLVTHDATVARHARRKIRIHDGVIEKGAFALGLKPSGSRQGSSISAAQAPATEGTV